MGLGGGADRSWLEPVNPDGNRGENITGCHTGNTEGLNVENAQPGMNYVWQSNKAPNIRRAMMDGYVVVGPDDPEMASMKKLGSINQGSLDTAQIYQDVILMKAPTERIRQIREKEQNLAQAMLRSGSDEFLNKVTEAERSLQHNPRQVSTRFSLNDHRIKVAAGYDEDSPEIDEWSPEHGILK